MKTAIAFAFLAGVPMLTPEHFSWLEMLRGAGALWIYSAVAQALPDPTPDSKPWYQFLYKFAHLLGANLPQAGVVKK